MLKIVAFAASSSRQSINKKLVTYATSLIVNASVEILDLNDYEMPLFSQDRENELGHPQLAYDFLDKIAGADALVISFAEHNSSYSAAYKSLFDWCSRINTKVFQDKPMVMLSTAPGARGGKSVLEQALSSAPRFTGQVKASLSVPHFHDNFDVEQGVLTNETLRLELLAAVNSLQSSDN
ncbi:NADPH-dependent FMN reductase [Neptunicella sp. SCSIO 80796]|uniref:NADPH-dependent FMN reductase n=1 Tax=Neptunicella plasticusilytica TaxID=3117012 RepID=UPI003A4DE94E